MSKERQKMSLINRAKQFAPFDALKGLRERLRLVEYEHERIEFGDISEEKAQKISNVLANLDKNHIVKVTYVLDGHKYIEMGNAKLFIYDNYLEINKKRIDLLFIHDIELVEN